MNRNQRKNRFCDDTSFLSKCAVFSLITCGAALFLTDSGLAQPIGGQVAGGQAVITQNGTATNVNQQSDRAIINWQSFDASNNESVNFNQPNSSSVMLNRVLSDNPTTFNGSLNSNGQLYLINQHGILFGQSARVNVGSLLATTANISDQEFLAGDLIFLDPGMNGEVRNKGHITVSPGGYVVLAAPFVANEGTIIAKLGQVNLASTNAFTLDFNGSGKIKFKVPEHLEGAVARSKTGIDQKGTIDAQGGTVQLDANLASEIAQSVVNVGGMVSATRISKDDQGNIFVNSNVGSIVQTGTLSTAGEKSQDGGHIKLQSSDETKVKGLILANAEGRGGEVRVLGE